MKIEQHVIICHTKGRETTDLTARVRETTTIQSGLCHIFLQHTSASLMICENYDPQVREDLENFFIRLVPDGDPIFQHTIEGDDDMPAHVRTILTGTDLTVPIQNGKLALGTWQGIYLYEHRYHGQARNILLTFLGA